jgi:hypothetical protein
MASKTSKILCDFGHRKIRVVILIMSDECNAVLKALKIGNLQAILVRI